MTLFRKQLPVLLLAVLLLGILLIPSPVRAAEIVYSGEFGSGLSWTLDNEGTLTVSGSGSMPFFEYGETPWKPCSELVKAVVVESGITSISSSAFSSLPRLVTVRIAGSVTYIGSYAFDDCSTLESVTLGEGVRELGWSSFSGCHCLRSITIPASVTALDGYAFFYCENLQEVTFLGDAPEFGSDVFGWNVLTAYYPLGNDTWTTDVRQGYGGTVTWVPSCVGEHAWTGWYELEIPTCQTEGLEEHFCTACFRREQRIIPAAAHAWGDWADTEGGQLRTCASCGSAEYTYNASQASCNIHKNNYPDRGKIDGTTYLFYRRWAFPITSALAAENGGYTRVECIDGVLVVEYYDQDLNFLSGRGFSLELPIYGGVYLGEDYNFVVSGQKNLEEDNQREVIRVTRYTKDWVRVDDANLYGGYTTVPFDAGSLRFARCGDMLYVRTCHEMYEASDGLNHQANVSLSIHIPTMEITDSNYTVSGASSGYAAHSFNQFVIVDGDDYIAVDHSDAYPRSVVMFRCQNGAGVPVFPYSREEIDVLPIAETTGHYNDTGVGVGGLVASSTHYIVVGNSADQSQTCDLRIAQRNIFVTATPKDDFSEEATTVYWLTDYTAEDDVETAPPQMVQVAQDRFLLIWTENQELRHCYINGMGELESEIYENDGALSDCVPILDGNRVLWYVTGEWDYYYQDYYYEVSDTPVFYQIDLEKPEIVTIANCDHRYKSTVIDPTCTEPGYTTHTCTICGRSYTDTPTDALGHNWGQWETVTAPTLEETGLKHRLCNTCGLEETAVLPVLEFLYGDANADGTVNGKDLILLRQRLAGWEVTLNEAAADTNGDGTVNGKDLILLRQCLAGWDVYLGPST